MESTVLNWRKSSYSGGNGGSCVEVAAADYVLIRDSKNTDGPKLTFNREAWSAFAAKVKRSLAPDPNRGLHACRGHSRV
jgi:hypothetical protein